MWYGRVTAFVGGCLRLSWLGRLFMYLVGLKPAKITFTFTFTSLFVLVTVVRGTIDTLTFLTAEIHYAPSYDIIGIVLRNRVS